MFFNRSIIFAPLNSVAGARVASFLRSENVEALSPFYGFVPYHPTDGLFEASASRRSPMCNGLQYGAAQGR